MFIITESGGCIELYTAYLILLCKSEKKCLMAHFRENLNHNFLIAKKQGIIHMLSLEIKQLCSGYIYIFLSICSALYQ